MARAVDEHQHAAKRDEILDTAEHLLHSKGYGEMTIQDILDARGISKGALYHYFESKDEVVDALLDRMAERAEARLKPIVSDASLSAVEKFHRYFAASGEWKAASRPLILAALRTWHSDQNAWVRQKFAFHSRRRTAPILAAFIRQGVSEGVFTTRYPDEVARSLATLGIGVGDEVAELLASVTSRKVQAARLRAVVEAYVEILARVLGVPGESLFPRGTGALDEWLPPPRPQRVRTTRRKKVV
jgi:AcrR family transcriptional regulator